MDSPGLQYERLGSSVRLSSNFGIRPDTKEQELVEIGEKGGDEAHLLSIPADGPLGNEDEEAARGRSGVKISIESLDRVADEGTRILFEVSLQVKAGQVMGIIGPSGSGKSTILRAINRLWEPPPGTVFVDGKDITKQNVLSVRRRFGMLFQTPILFDGTVAENVNYGPSLAGRKLNAKEIEGLLEAADLDASFASRSIVGLSVGQAQRVALARTLANEPEILLLDEPTSALDPISTRNIEDTVVKLARSQGLTVVLVSHSLDQVRRVADVLCLVVGGEVLQVMKPDELEHSNHRVVQEFLAAASSQAQGERGGPVSTPSAPPL